MKKLFIYTIFCLSIILTGCSSTENNNTKQDSPKETIDEENTDQINNLEREPEVLVDQDEIYIEYRGFAEYTDSEIMMNIYIENKSDTALIVNFNDSSINQCQIEISNSSVTVDSNTKYLSKPNYDFIISFNDIREYDINSIDELKFNLVVNDDSFDNIIVKKKITLTPALAIPHE